MNRREILNYHFHKYDYSNLEHHLGFVRNSTARDGDCASEVVISNQLRHVFTILISCENEASAA